MDLRSSINGDLTRIKINQQEIHRERRSYEVQYRIHDDTETFDPISKLFSFFFNKTVLDSFLCLALYLSDQTERH